MQTGSGKTHTMLGDIDELEIKPSLNRGMTPRIFEFLFARIRAVRLTPFLSFVQSTSDISILTIFEHAFYDSLPFRNRKVVRMRNYDIIANVHFQRSIMSRLVISLILHQQTYRYFRFCLCTNMTLNTHEMFWMFSDN